MRRTFLALAVALGAAVPASSVATASGANVPAWLHKLAHDAAVDLGEAKPRSTTFVLREETVIIVLHGDFTCARPQCPFLLSSGPAHARKAVPPHGTIAKITVNEQTHAVTRFALRYPFLSVGPGSSPPARLRIAFVDAALGPIGAFSSLTRRTALLPFPLGVATSARARRIAALHARAHNHVLLVAPTNGGGFCTSLSGPYGGTGCPRTGRVGPPSVLNPGLTSDASGPILFDGYLTLAGAARLQVRYEDGSTATIPFVWVSKPINAGFFVFDLSAHRQPGHRPAVLSLFDHAGNLLHRQQIPRFH